MSRCPLPSRSALTAFGVLVERVPGPQPPPESGVQLAGFGAVPAGPVNSSDQTSVLYGPDVGPVGEVEPAGVATGGDVGGAGWRASATVNFTAGPWLTTRTRKWGCCTALMNSTFTPADPTLTPGSRWSPTEISTASVVVSGSIETMTA